MVTVWHRGGMGWSQFGIGEGLSSGWVGYTAVDGWVGYTAVGGRGSAVGGQGQQVWVADAFLPSLLSPLPAQHSE